MRLVAALLAMFATAVIGPALAQTSLRSPDFATRPANDNSTAAATTAYVDALLKDQPQTHGALCNGLADDGAALLATAAAAGRVTIPSGCVLRVASTRTITGPVAVQAGGRIKADNAIVTLSAGLSGPLSRIIELVGTGKVQLAAATQQVIYPEWWYDIGIGDYLPAFVAATHSGALNMVLQPFDYGLGGTWKIDVPYFRVRGSGRWANQIGNVTTIRIYSATADAIQIGPDVMPPEGINYFQKGNLVSDIEVGRAMLPTATTVSADQGMCSGPVGVKVKYTLDTHIRDTMSSGHSIAYDFAGVVSSHVDRNFASRVIVGTNTTTDCWIGYRGAGPATPGLAGLNGSLYLANNNGSSALAYPKDNDPAATVFYQPAFSAGIVLYNGFVDTFIDNFEGGGTKHGIWVDGASSGCTAVPLTVSCAARNIDLHIYHPVIDIFGVSGITFQNINPGSAIEVIGGYYAAGIAYTDAAASCRRISNAKGSLTFLGGQCIGGLNSSGGGTALGTYADNSSGIRSVDFKAIGLSRPASLISVSYSEWADTYVNPQGFPATQAAVFVDGVSHHNVFRPTIRGYGIPQGVYLVTSANHHNTVDATMIDPTATPYPVAYINAGVTALGTFGNANVRVGAPD